MTFHFNKTKPKNEMPRMGLIIGGPKVGKSSFIATIPNCLILDLEGVGYDHIEAEAVSTPASINELREGIVYFFESDFEVLAIDHLRILTKYFCDAIASNANVKLIDQIGFGKGQAELRHDIFKMFSFIRESVVKTKKSVVFVAHSTDRNSEVRLDVDAKIDTMITGFVDYIGLIYRSGPINKINFKSQSGSEFGCRNKNLANYNDVANWEKLIECSKKD